MCRSSAGKYRCVNDESYVSTDKLGELRLTKRKK